MKKHKHTPGPWIADGFAEENDRPTRVCTYDGSPVYYHRSATIAHVQHNWNDERVPGEPRIGIINAEANARLISAAPDLLEAAELLEKAEETHANCTECEGEEVPELCPKCFPLFDDARIKRRLAIAKAIDAETVAVSRPLSESPHD